MVEMKSPTKLGFIVSRSEMRREREGCRLSIFFRPTNGG